MTYRTFDGTSQSETIVDGRFSSSGDIALADGTATQGAIYFADDKNTGIYSPSNDQIAFTTAGSAALTLASDNAASFTGDIKIESDMPRIWLTDTNSDSDFSLYNGNGTFTIKDETTTALPIRIYSGSGGTDSGNAGAIQIDGNLDATAGIDVTGLATFSSNIEARGASDVKLYLGSTGSTTGNNNVHVRADGANLNFMAASGGITKFEVNGTETLNISDTGNATFGGNVTINGGASTQLTVKGTEADLWLTSTGSGSDKVWRILGSTGGSTHQFRIRDNANDRDPFVIADDGNATFSHNVIFNAGYGCHFGAATGSGSASTVLDDYEEGTWTPGFANGFSAAEITNGTNGAIAKGWYTKIGDLVTAQFYMRLGTSGTSTTDGNQIKINGFPFDAKNTSEYNGGGTTTYVDFVSTIGEVSEAVSVYGPDPGTAVAQLYRGSQAYYASNSADQTGKYIIGMATYKV